MLTEFKSASQLSNQDLKQARCKVLVWTPRPCHVLQSSLKRKTMMILFIRAKKKAPKKILVHITAWIRILGSSTLTLLLAWSPFIDLASPLIDYIQQGTEYPELITQNKISDLDTNLHIILPQNQEPLTPTIKFLYGLLTDVTLQPRYTQGHKRPECLVSLIILLLWGVLVF